MLIIVDLSLARVVQHSLFQFHAFAYRYRSSTKLSFRSHAARHALDDHYLLTEMITPQTYKNIYIHIRPLPVSRVFGARSGSPRTSGDENHLCGASLRENHKIHCACGIDCHHIGMGLVPQTTACSMSVSQSQADSVA